MNEQEQTLTVVPTSYASTAISAGDVLEQKRKIQELMKTVFIPGVHFGKIPGTGKDAKPALFKAGSEYLIFAFNLRPHTEMTPVYTPDGHLTCSVRVVLHASDGTYLGDGYGVCSTRETKYAFKRGDMVCPDCGKAAIRKSKEEYGGGWYCNTRANGCGAKFGKNDARFANQDATTPTNPADFYNTVTKMAHKRALVGAVLVTTAASSYFTQDLEDTPGAACEYLEQSQCEAIAAEIQAVGADPVKMLEVLGISHIYELRESHLATIQQTIDGHRRRNMNGRNQDGRS